MKNGEECIHRVIELSPPNIRNDVVAFVSMLHETLNAWITGQGTVIIILCMTYTVGLSLIQAPYAITLGILTGLLYIIPVAGFILALTLTSIITISSSGFDGGALLQVIALYGSIQIVEALFLSPYLIGNKLGLNLPSALLVIMIGGGLFGATGIILAIPVTSFLKRAGKYIIQKNQHDWIYD